MYVQYALMFAAITAGIYFVIDAAQSLLSRDESVWVSVTSGLAIFVSLFGFSWLTLLLYTPALHFGNVFWFSIVCAMFVLMFGFFRPGFVESDRYGTHRWSNRMTVPAGAIAAVIFIVMALIFGSFHSFFKTDGQQMATWLANQADVTHAGRADYPDTDPEHMMLVPEQAARYKANQALNQGGTNIATLYDMNGGGDLQSVEGHMYWIFDLGFTWNDRNKVDGHVPAYIRVDAETHTVRAELVDGWDIKYFPGGPIQYSIDRLIWEKYPDYVIDDVTLEVNDDGRPYYTATANRPATTFETSLPVMALVIDPQTGEIDEYSLELDKNGENELPKWVDRVYSDDTAEQMLNWWGHWGAGPEEAPFRRWREKKANRYKVNGDPQLVYVDDGGNGHASWQIQLSSWRRDNVTQYLAMFDARTGAVELFQYDGLQQEDTVIKAFDQSRAATQARTHAVEPSLHMIYGELTWVVGLVRDPDADDGGSGLAALGMMPAQNGGANRVSYAENLGDLLDAYRVNLLSNVDSDSPSESIARSQVTGTVSRVAPVAAGGGVVSTPKVDFVLSDVEPRELSDVELELYDGELPDDTQFVYRGQLNDTALLELRFLEPGDQVIVTFADVGASVRTVTGIDVVNLSLEGIIEESDSTTSSQEDEAEDATVASTSDDE